MKFFRLPRLLLLLGPLLLCSASGCRAQKKIGVPAELDGLMQTATSAVNGKDFTALQSLTEGDPARVLAWIRDTPNTKWQTDYLLPPGSDAARDSFLVFHHWHTCESDGDHVHHLTKAANGWKIGAEIPETDTGGYRVRDHDLTVTFDIPQQSATIHDAVMLERGAHPKFAFVLMRLSEDFTVTRFTDGKDNPVTFNQVGGIVAFTAPKAQKFTLKLDYSGRVDHKGSDYIHENEATLDSYWYPNIARLPAAATVTVTAPAGWTPIAQGEQTAEKIQADGSLTRTFRNSIPTCFFTVDAGKYFITSRKAGRLTLSVYLLHKDDALAKKSLDTLQSAIAFYESNFSPYPYTHYTVVETLGPFGGALEAYSFATFGAGSLRDTIPHELAHTWWGGIVPCAYTESMWNESFAEYSDDLFRRFADKRAENGSKPMFRPDGSKTFNAFPLTTAHDTEDNRQSAVGYDKGKLVMRALEAEIGLEPMQKSLAAFIANHPRGETADWPEFETVVNKATGRNYRWFFAQWTERVGMPSAHLENPLVKRDGADYVVEADFVQTGEQTYRLSVPLVLDTDGKFVKTILQAEGKTTHIVIRTKFAPKELRADPKGTLPLAPPVLVAGQEAMRLKF